MSEENVELMEEKDGGLLGPYVFLGLAVLYALLPFDLVPDVPVVGWVDDISLLLVSSLNLAEKKFGEVGSSFRKKIRFLKWSVVGVGVVLTVLVGLFGVALIKFICS